MAIGRLTSTGLSMDAAILVHHHQQEVSGELDGFLSPS